MDLNKYSIWPIVWSTGHYPPKEGDDMAMHLLIRSSDYVHDLSNNIKPGLHTLYRNTVEYKAGEDEDKIFLSMIEDYFKEYDKLGKEKMLEIHQKEFDERMKK